MDWSLVAFIMVLSIFLSAPLLEQANPGMSPITAKAPWYFLGFQELLFHLHPVFRRAASGRCSALFRPACGCRSGAIPRLPPGRWFGSARGRKLAAPDGLAGGALAAFARHVCRGRSAAALNARVLRGEYVYYARSGSRRLLVIGLLMPVFTFCWYVQNWNYTRAEAVMAGRHCSCLSR